MTNTVWENREYKKVVRECIIEHVKVTAKTAVFLPGPNLVDVYLAYANNAIDEKTKLVLYESNKAAQRSIDRHIADPKTFLKEENIVRVYEDIFKKNLPDHVTDIDLAIIDLCCVTDERIRRWMWHTAFNNKFSEQAQVWLTFMLNPRNSKKKIARSMFMSNHLPGPKVKTEIKHTPDVYKAMSWMFDCFNQYKELDMYEYNDTPGNGVLVRGIELMSIKRQQELKFGHSVNE